MIALIRGMLTVDSAQRMTLDDVFASGKIWHNTPSLFLNPSLQSKSAGWSNPMEIADRLINAIW